jgi:hypothetical protein
MNKTPITRMAVLTSSPTLERLGRSHSRMRILSGPYSGSDARHPRRERSLMSARGKGLRRCGAPFVWRVSSLLRRGVSFSNGQGRRRRTESESSLSTVYLQPDYHRHPREPNRWLGLVLLLKAGRDRIISSCEVEALRPRYSNAQVHRFEGAGPWTS